jgi:ABC-type branched-subunit amino acid transport system substrate-binding protein
MKTFDKPVVLMLATIAAALSVLGCGGGKAAVDFGAILPLSGEDALYGEAIRNGIELAAEQVAADESFGYEITLTVEDSGGDAERAAVLAEQMFQTADAMIGGVTSREALAMAEIAKSRGKVLLSPSASATQLSGIAPGNFFRIYPTSDDEAVTMMNFTRDTLGVDDIVLVVEDNAFGTNMAESYREAWDGEVAAEAVFAPDQADLSEMAATVMASGSKTAVVAATGSELARAIEALRNGGFTGQGYRILTNSAIASRPVLEAAGEAAWGVYFTMTQVDLEQEQGPLADFRDAYSTKYGVQPDVFAAYGYDAFNVLVQALREKGDTSSVLPGDIQKGMRAISNYPGITGSIQFRESGDVQQFERIFYITEGTVVDFDSWWRDRQEEIRKRQEDIRRQLEQLNREGG